MPDVEETSAQVVSASPRAASPFAVDFEHDVVQERVVDQREQHAA